MKTYVVGTDGSETAARAAKRAGDLAAKTGATVHVVCAYDRRGGSTESCRWTSRSAAPRR